MHLLASTMNEVANGIDKSFQTLSNNMKKESFDDYNLQKPAKQCYPRIKPDIELLENRNNELCEDLLFRFGGGLINSSGRINWMVLIYTEYSNRITKCYFDRKGLTVKTCIRRPDNKNTLKYSEYIIENKTYNDIIDFCKVYDDSFPEYSILSANCRRFVIRLAEFCDIPINGIVAGSLSSPCYSIQDIYIDQYKQKNLNDKCNQFGKSISKCIAKIFLSTQNHIIYESQSVANGVTHFVEHYVLP